MRWIGKVLLVAMIQQQRILRVAQLLEVQSSWLLLLFPLVLLQRVGTKIKTCSEC